MAARLNKSMVMIAGLGTVLATWGCGGRTNTPSAEPSTTSSVTERMLPRLPPNALGFRDVDDRELFQPLKEEQRKRLKAEAEAIEAGLPEALRRRPVLVDLGPSAPPGVRGFAVPGGPENDVLGPGYGLNIGKLMRLATILAALGDAEGASRRFSQVLEYDERNRDFGMVLSNLGEAAFSPLELARRFWLRDASLSFPELNLKMPIHRWVWETKGFSTRALERAYAAIRRLSPEGPPLDEPMVLDRGDENFVMKEQRQRIDVRRRIVSLMLEPTEDHETRDLVLAGLLDMKNALMSNNVSLLSRTHVPDALAAVHAADVNSLLRALPVDAVFLDFLRFDRLVLDAERPGPQGDRHVPSYVAFVASYRVGRSGIARVDLGPCRPIDEAVLLWRRAIERGELAEAEGAAVARKIWTPIRSAFPPDISTVYISTDGALSVLPWAALPGKEPGTVLIEEFALAQVPHGPFLLGELLRSRSPEEWREHQLRVQGKVGLSPVFGGMNLSEALESLVEPRPPADEGLPVLLVGGVHPDLPGSAREIRRIEEQAGGHPVVVLSGRQATPTRVMSELTNAGYALISTHGFFAESALRADRQRLAARAGSNPSASSIILAPQNSLPYSGLILSGDVDSRIADRVLTSETIPEFPLNRLMLCFLGSCETGLGDATTGEGVLGLTRAFQLAGCPNVIASQWKVSDDASELLITDFFRRLWSEGQPPIEALRQAQLELRRHPERIISNVKGRAGPLDMTATEPVNPSKSGRGASPKSGRARTAPPKAWAAYFLSGVGR